jgi:hypothetical protein
MTTGTVSVAAGAANGWRASRALRAALLGLVLAGAATSASAISIRELRALEASDKDQGVLYVQYYLVGAMEGLLEANAQVARTGGKPSICPNGRKLEPRMAKPLYDGELRRNAGLYEADMPVQLVMLNAMVAAYAC